MSHLMSILVLSHRVCSSKNGNSVDIPGKTALLFSGKESILRVSADQSTHARQSVELMLGALGIGLRLQP